MAAGPRRSDLSVTYLCGKWPREAPDDSLALNERAAPRAMPKVEIIGLAQAGTNEGRPLAANRPSSREIADAVRTTPLVMGKFNSAF